MPCWPNPCPIPSSYASSCLPCLLRPSCFPFTYHPSRRMALEIDQPMCAVNGIVFILHRALAIKAYTRPVSTDIGQVHVSDPFSFTVKSNLQDQDLHTKPNPQDCRTSSCSDAKSKIKFPKNHAARSMSAEVSVDNSPCLLLW